MPESKVLRILLVTMIGGLLLSGCFWPPPGPGPDPDPDPTLVSIAVSPIDSSAFVGATVEYTAVGTYSDGNTDDLTTDVDWTSSNPSIPISNADGLQGFASANALGTTTVTATEGSVSGTTTLTVVKEVASVAITPNNPDFPRVPFINNTAQFTLTATYTDGTTENVTDRADWGVPAPNPAMEVGNTAGKKGLVTRLGQADGDAPITATFGGKSDVSAVTLPEIQAKQLDFHPDVRTIATVGGTLQLTVTVPHFGGPTFDVSEVSTWSTTDPNITVSNAPGSKGLVTRTGAATGPAVIHFDYAGYAQDVTVTLL